MTGPGQMFSDGKVYERMMGRWSKLVGRIFLDWLAAPKGLHWLAITFVPDSAKAVAEMARVVRPGGLIATYMWDIAGGGLPLAPVGRALKAMNKDYARVSENAARRKQCSCCGKKPDCKQSKLASSVS